MDNIEHNNKAEKLIQPAFIAEIPETKVEGDYELIISPIPEGRCMKSIIKQCVAAARQSAGRIICVMTHVKARGVDSDDTIPMDLIDSDAESEGGLLLEGVTLGIKKKNGSQERS